MLVLVSVMAMMWLSFAVATASMLGILPVMPLAFTYMMFSGSLTFLLLFFVLVRLLIFLNLTCLLCSLRLVVVLNMLLGAYGGWGGGGLSLRGWLLAGFG